ncbi:SNARE domain protein [Aspergillus thermomutatus]|uniref:t-SNARE affecting a late Golgi compartment protein 1 n=1 Tax=Aspergillus thermomutatus TaxID=41047 RepID=A0A397GWC5_ASPTH|nr:uncharacterized protein CDV56_104739 [Aspergillus thermomutatus]RHZ53968.1 hypothetical protein CDV56_104739 [Aspergillus thermomutatus]
MATVLNLRLVNKSTYETIGSLEPHICRWFMRLHDIHAFAPLITLDPQTGGQRPLTVHTLPRFIYRQRTASQLARRIIPSVWGPYNDDGNPEMDYNAELKLAQTLERGLHVLFHFADASLDTEMPQVEDREKSATYGPERPLELTWASDLYDDLLQHRSRSMNFDKSLDHIYAALEWGHVEAEIGRKRLRLRSYLDEQTEIDFHTALRMLRELMERMLLRHGPKDWHRDAKNEYSLISWFMLKQSPRTLAKLFLSPQDKCCHLDDKTTDGGVRECRFADPLDIYWKEWKNDLELRCRDCDCRRRVRSWSVKPAVIDARGREFNRAAERYLKETWSQRHVTRQRKSNAFAGYRDVLSTLQSSRPLFSSYLRIRSLAKSPSNPELQQARSELEATLTDLTADLDDLVESVRAIEQDPYRYGLEIEEVARRRKLVDEVGDEVEKMREELQRVVTTADTVGSTRTATSGLPNPADFDNVLSPSADDRGDDYYSALEQQRQMELMHEQDEQLDGVFQTVGNLRQQADDMGRELEEQAVMIDEVDTLADRVGGKLSDGMSRIKHIVRKNEGK